MRCTLRVSQAVILAGLVIGLLCFTGRVALAYESLGVGTESLIGGDLTDPEDDGDPEFDDGYNAIFAANSEPGFGSGEEPEGAGNGEAAFNVFDNLLGPANDKWCCGKPGGFPEEGLWVDAEFDQPYMLTHFTVSSANDAEGRDPIIWAVQGSNDGETYTDIYRYDDDFGPWVDRLEVIEFSAPEDFPVQTTGYKIFRHVTYETENNLNGNAAYFQIGEIEYFGEPGGGGQTLQAGDANQDLEFNQLDLVKVQIAAKYLTGQPATWGEGDWDGAPGGSPGSPPTGNGLFDQVDIIAALTAGKYLTGPYAALALGAGDGNATIVYNAGTGEVAVQAGATELTSINIDSAASIFTGDAAQNLGGSFDNDADNNIFKATFGGSFGSLSFGNVAQAGLSEDFVRNDLTVVGSLSGGGDLGAVGLIYVPEPASMILLVLGIAAAGLMTGRRGK